VPCIGQGVAYRPVPVHYPLHCTVGVLYGFGDAREGDTPNTPTIPRPFTYSLVLAPYGGKDTP